MLQNIPLKQLKAKRTSPCSHVRRWHWHTLYYYFYYCVMSAFPACTQMLYVNTHGQLRAMLNALFIFVKGGCGCTRVTVFVGRGLEVIEHWFSHWFPLIAYVRQEANQASYGPVVWCMCAYVLLRLCMGRNVCVWRKEGCFLLRSHQ